MIESEDGTVTGSIDVSRLDAIEPKTDEAKAQLAALKGEVQAGQEQAGADAERLAEQSREQAVIVRGDDGVERPLQPDAVDGEADSEPGQRDDQDVEALRAEAEGLGVPVDRRWGANRLRQEIDAARQQAVSRGNDELP